MYIFQRVWHDKLVTTETRLKIEHQNCYSFIAVQQKVKLAKSQRHSANTEKRINENVQGGGGRNPPQGRVNNNRELTSLVSACYL